MDVGRLGEMFSESTRRRIQKRLREADISMIAEDYLGYSLILFLALLFVLLPFFPPLALILSALALSLALYLPSYLSVIRARQAERELPLFLKSLSTLLKSGIPAIESLRISSVSLRTLRKSIERIISLHRSGRSLRRSFDTEISTYRSDRVKKTLYMVYEVIEGGHGVNSLERYADSLLGSKKIEIREFSSKLALYTLIFIAITALAPSILIMYSLLLPTVFGSHPDPALISFILFFLIPLITLVTLGYITTQVSV